MGWCRWLFSVACGNAWQWSRMTQFLPALWGSHHVWGLLVPPSSLSISLWTAPCIQTLHPTKGPFPHWRSSHNLGLTSRSSQCRLWKRNQGTLRQLWMFPIVRNKLLWQSSACCKPLQASDEGFCWQVDYNIQMHSSCDKAGEQAYPYFTSFAFIINSSEGDRRGFFQPTNWQGRWRSICRLRHLTHWWMMLRTKLRRKSKILLSPLSQCHAHHCEVLSVCIIDNQRCDRMLSRQQDGILGEIRKISILQSATTAPQALFIKE